MTSTKTEALIAECERQIENCRDTAVSFILWLRWLRWIRTAFHTAPIIFGALATWKIVAQGPPEIAAVFALLATVLPPLGRAFKVEKAIGDYEELAGEFINLRDRFRQAATISSLSSFEEFEAATAPYLTRLEKARRRALAPPEWFFRRAREKIGKGHYDHDRDGSRQG